MVAKLPLNIITSLDTRNLSLEFANNKGADQPAHTCGLISTIVIRFWKVYLKLLQAKF